MGLGNEAMVDRVELGRPRWGEISIYQPSGAGRPGASFLPSRPRAKLADQTQRSTLGRAQSPEVERGQKQHNFKKHILGCLGGRTMIQTCQNFFPMSTHFRQNMAIFLATVIGSHPEASEPARPEGWGGVAEA